jgi:hypothetical protein
MERSTGTGHLALQQNDHSNTAPLRDGWVGVNRKGGGGLGEPGVRLECGRRV